jgi:[ribosomal protein S18]-alanine N-acetyltransferase
MKSLECRKLTIEWKEPLLAFLKALEEANDTEYFRPHDFSNNAVEKIIQDTCKDLYYVLVEEQEVIGYGLLRGWDEGYKIPSLGIAIHPKARGTGLGKTFMYFLHSVARQCNAEKMRLRVRVNNIRAIKLYQDLGYFFATQEGQYLVGTLDLCANVRKYDKG